MPPFHNPPKRYSESTLENMNTYYEKQWSACATIVRLIPLDQIKQGRKYSSPEYKQFRNKIERLGVRNPVKLRYRVSSGSYIVVDGGWRVQAARELGYNTIPAFVEDINEQYPPKRCDESTVKKDHEHYPNLPFGVKVDCDVIRDQLEKFGKATFNNIEMRMATVRGIPAGSGVYYDADHNTVKLADGGGNHYQNNAYTNSWSEEHQAYIHQICTPHVRGSRKINYDEHLDDSVRRIGVSKPIIVKHDYDHPSRYVVINGNARLNSAAKHKLPFIPCIVIEKEKNTMNKQCDRVELLQDFQVVGCTYPNEEDGKIYHYKLPVGPVLEIGQKVIAPSPTEGFFVLVTVKKINVEPDIKKGWKYKYLVLGTDINAWQGLMDEEAAKEKMLKAAVIKAEITKARQQVEDLVGPEQMKLLTNGE